MRFNDVLVRCGLEGKSDAEIVRFMHSQFGLVSAFMDEESKKNFGAGTSNERRVWINRKEVKALDTIVARAAGDRTVIKEVDAVVGWMNVMDLPFNKVA